MQKSSDAAPGLPPAFVRRIREQLGEESERFLDTYDQPRTSGLRLNPLKLGAQSDKTEGILSLFRCEPVPWCPTGYYYEETTRPGKHPYHAAGLYYIQEPSAMSPVEWLRPEPGDVVLDLAAAPGGKATQIAARLAGEGLLIANEIHPGRAAVLAENIERWGAANCIVTQCSPDQLARRFPHFFDKILLDAPCSGEGMFRKNPETIAEWSPEHVHMCAARQRDILGYAVSMLKPGGTLAYSTCTFAEKENEQIVSWALETFPELECIQMERLWPHLERGEGHFAAILRKGEDAAFASDTDHAPSRRERTKPRRQDKELEETWRAFTAFAAETLPDLHLPDGEPVLFGDQLYWLPYSAGQHPFAYGGMQGLKILRPGLHLAARKKSRIEPAHALALSAANGLYLKDREPDHVVNLPADDEAVAAYLRGEAIGAGERSAAGWVLVAADGFPLGWGKSSSGRINNHYPKGLRRLE